jgi:hypothetical protein
MFLHAHFQLGKGGGIGVEMFFVISGFFIAHTYLRYINPVYEVKAKVLIKDENKADIIKFTNLIGCPFHFWPQLFA